MAFDTVIRHGTIVDGSGAARYAADLAIDEGRIVAIGDLGEERGTVEIDAAGLIVSPGFIDVHIHSEVALIEPATPNRYGSVRQGVTTQLLAPDGFGWTHLEGELFRQMWDYTRFATGDAKLGGPWPRAEDYLALFDGTTPANVVPEIPHLPIRLAAMGWDDRPATDAELDLMRELVREWLDAGAVAFNTGLDYQPTAFADTRELIELSKVVVEGGAIYAAHIRYNILGRDAAWRETFEISREAGIPVHISHENVDDISRPLLDEAAGTIDVTFESYMYPAGCTHLAMTLPTWAQAGGTDGVYRRLQDPEIRKQLTEYLQESLTVGEGRPGKLTIAANQSGSHIGRTVAEVAEEQGLPIGEAAMRMLIAEHPYALTIYHRRYGDDVARTIAKETFQHPAMMVASDGIYHGTFSHPRASGCFARAIRMGVRELQAVTLEEAIYKMSGFPATRFHVPHRGFIRTGYAADLVLFDEATIADGATWERPLESPTGIELVMVGGEPVVRRNVPTGALPGKVLRRQDATVSA
ncbi:MAG: amidohydrolase family protein [Thermomicrobiales bacterium]|nr:amidohydrolase family protein [Thermomicrobiales bacterium]